MAKQVSVRLTSEGGERVKAVLSGLGLTGEQAFERIQRSSKSAANSAELFERALDSEMRQVNQLRASLDPLYRSSMQYSSAVEQVNSAVERGLISQREAVRINQMAEKAYLGVGDNITKVGGAAGRSRHGLRNLALQLNQVGQQGAVTGDYLGALAIQIPDMMVGFGLWAIAIGAVAAVLGPFVLDLFRGADAAKAHEASVKAMSEAYGQFSGAADVAVSDLDSLKKKYGENAAEVRALYTELVKVEKVQALSGLRTAVQESSDTIDGMRDRLQDFSDAWDEVRTARQQRNDGFVVLKGQIVELEDQMQAAREKLEEDFGLTTAEAYKIRDALDAVGNASGPAEAAEAARRLSLAISDAYDGSTEIPPEMSDIARFAADAYATFAQIEKISGDVARGIGLAADEAGRLASNLALSETVRARQVEAGIKDGSIPPWAANDLPPSQADIVMEQILAERRRKARQPAKPGRSGRSGAGGIDRATREAERAAQAYDRLMGSFSPLLDAQRDFEQNQKVVNDALAAGRITSADHAAAMEMVSQAYDQARMEIEDQGLLDAIDSVSDAMAQAIIDGENMGEALKRVFQQIATDLMSSGIKDLLKGLFTGGGSSGGGGLLSGLLGGLFGVKSFEGGGYTGNVPRTGGLDGRGGFLAMVHGNETVTDHTRGNGATSQSLSVTVTMDPSTAALGAFVRDTSGRVVAEASPGIAKQGAQEAFARMNKSKTGWA